MEVGTRLCWKASEPEAVPVEKREMEPILKMEDVHFSYGDREDVLKGIDLEIFPGEFVAVVGPNGSGKSTLAKTAVGLIKPKKGLTMVCGMDTKRARLHEITGTVGFCFQNPDVQLFCHEVDEELAFGLRERGVPEEEIEPRVMKALRLVHLEESVKRHPQAHSRGERKRLAAATALVTSPRMIILDEPTTGQDDRNLEGCLSLMTNLTKEENAAILMITHDIKIVLQYADRVLVLHDGIIVLDGDRNIFIDHAEELSALRLMPPILPRLAEEHFPDKRELVLTLGDLSTHLLSAGSC
jgi:energy-coupling factor transport system ATP-binding protein